VCSSSTASFYVRRVSNQLSFTVEWITIIILKSIYIPFHTSDIIDYHTGMYCLPQSILRHTVHFMQPPNKIYYENKIFIFKLFCIYLHFLFK
jgi:hypothetical protein